MQFQPIKKDNLIELAPYFQANKTRVSDFSLGFQFMWSEYMRSEYAIVNGCLLVKEVFEGKTYFHYPLSPSGEWAEEEGAILAIEGYCRDENVRLHYTNVPKERVGVLTLRYGASVKIENPRAWRDYLYRAEDFRSYAGGKYAGQRNHANKFARKYPEWSFRAYEPSDEGLVRAFLAEYAVWQRQKNSLLADEELKQANELLPYLSLFQMSAGLLFVGEKLVAFTVGERCGDMLVVHIEKALRAYEGAYPFIAQQFALAFADGVEYLNRMDDAGEAGLRKSKLQYLPCALVDKFNVYPSRAIDEMKEGVEIACERVKIAPLTEEQGEAYRALASNVERNRYWGYDYRADYEGEPPAEWFLRCAREDFAEKNELAEGIYLYGRLIGEVVLHRFGYQNEVEVGARILPEYEGHGYASEAIRAMSGYALTELGLERVEAKCFRANERSKRMLLSAGFHPSGEDERYFYFYKLSSH